MCSICCIASDAFYVCRSNSDRRPLPKKGLPTRAPAPDRAAYAFIFGATWGCSDKLGGLGEICGTMVLGPVLAGEGTSALLASSGVVLESLRVCWIFGRASQRVCWFVGWAYLRIWNIGIENIVTFVIGMGDFDWGFIT